MEIEILAIRPSSAAADMPDWAEVYVAWGMPNRATVPIGNEGIDWLFLSLACVSSLPQWNFDLLDRIIHELVPSPEFYKQILAEEGFGAISS